MSDMLAMLMGLENSGAVREDYVRAPFGYPGAKDRSLKEILPHLPYRVGYCEPFGGTGAVLLARHESKLEVFNDRYAGVVAFYRCVRDPAKIHQLVDRLQLILHSREEFIWCRETWENCEDDVERAARWYYMTAVSFGQQGRHFGRSVRTLSQIGPKLVRNLELFAGVHNRMKCVQVENLDWRHCLKDFDCEDMVWYMDPTYYEYSKGMYMHEMTKADHKEMLERIQYLRGFVALSGYDNELYNSYPWDEKYEWRVHNSALGLAFTDTNNLAGKERELTRGYSTEVLWIKKNHS